jgi:proline dehydrogenase
MLRQGLLWLSEQPRAFRAVRSSRLARSFASRFVAGETAAEAIDAARALAGRGLTATLDLLGESVTRPSDAETAAEGVLDLLDRMQAAGLPVNASVKLTQLGFGLDPDLCRGLLERILVRARAADGFVRIDMEGSDLTGPTLDLFRDHLHPRFGDHVGVVLQSMLRRTDADLEALLALRARVRLVKGAYLESPAVAYPAKRDVDAAFARQAGRLLAQGHRPALATHDERLIEAAIEAAARAGAAPDRFEFQMLYGVRRDLQRRTP